jgi:nucleoside-triphosphatase
MDLPAAGSDHRHLLLTGAPGSGKTTVLVSVVCLLRERGRPVRGFWTQEVRRRGTRQGFVVELASGGREVLASIDFPGPPRVARYGVRLEAVDRLVVPEIEQAIADTSHHPETVLVIDEIGKMELFSEAFRRAVLAAFGSPLRIVATVMEKPHPFADSLKARPDATVLTVTRANRAGLPERVLALIG